MTRPTPGQPRVGLPELLRQLDGNDDPDGLPAFDLDAAVLGGRRRRRRRTAATLVGGVVVAGGLALLGTGATHEESLVPARPPAVPTAPVVSPTVTPDPRVPAPSSSPTPRPQVVPSAPASAPTRAAAVPSAAAPPRAALPSRAAASPPTVRPAPAGAPAATGTTAPTGTTPPPVGAPAPTGTSPSPPATSRCAALAGSTFVQAVSAGAAGGGVSVAAHPVTARCGGPDDVQFVPAASSETLQLAAGAAVTVLQTDTSIAARQIAPADLPAWLSTDPGGKIFSISGPVTAVTAMVEQYHP